MPESYAHSEISTVKKNKYLSRNSYILIQMIKLEDPLTIGLTSFTSDLSFHSPFYCSHHLFSSQSMCFSYLLYLIFF